MSTQTFSAQRLVTANGVLDWPRITVDTDGLIRSIEVCAGGESDGTTLAPGFFDVHVHGAAGHDVMEGSPESFAAVGQFLARRGVGHYLATTVTAAIEATVRALDGIATQIERTPAEYAANGSASPVGIHLEGPFLSQAKRGVHPVDALAEPSLELFERFWQAGRGHIRLMTIAPELPGALELIRHATDRGVRVSLGHSDATAAQARAGIVAGAVSATHTFNAMRRLDHREPGLAGVVLDSEELYAELICDGIHIAPEFVRLWMLAKGEARGILITDGTSATGMPDGEYELGGQSVAVAGGRCLLASDLRRGIETLAGSVLTLERAIENLLRYTGASLETAVQLASRNPARMTGFRQLEELAVGEPATFNLFGPGGELRDTFLRGQRVSSAGRA